MRLVDKKKSENFYKLFKPQLTPQKMLEMGVFGGSYFGGKIKEYRFEKIKEEVIETAIGSFNTTKLARYKKNKQETFLWCAHELNFLPIKVITKEKDGRIS